MGVDAPGGPLHISVLADGAMELVGPAEIVAQGTVNLPRSDRVL
ncbi:hypothetical protein [Streptantibioticus ferralitis]|uniref:Uncharacterized protein n=1 Tax=Streptantibioticus ferralitis TaxID=236510 RepID=A0ABT5Z7F3_9ACTN|nr:hypothetical protein [Streptantibioticus ferralitis]MDF2259762.1 hypothetical protein [Streptantibioticus ferralitis]